MPYKANPVINLILSVGLCLTTAGCAAGIIVAVGAGALGGYAISRDTFEGITSRGPEELWDAANLVTSIMGTVENSDRKLNQIQAVISGARVTVTILPVNLTTTKLRIKARKAAIFPAIDVAQNVYSKIMNQLEEK